MSAHDTPGEAAQRQLDAYNARDLEAFLAVYAADCVVRTFPSGDVLMQGLDAMRERYGKQFESCPELHARLLGRTVHESFAVDHEEVVGLRAGETVHAVAMYEVLGGLIQNVWFIRDRQ